jgi:ubiquinone/menaquinone biosynthesis C-methylase UbiE
MNDNFETQYDKSALEFNEFYLNQEAHQSTDAFFKTLNETIDITNLKNKNVLDLGCGAGADSLFYTSRGLTYCGVDASAEMCSLASENQHVAEIRNETFSRSMSYEEQQFGLIVSKYAMQTAEDINTIYKESFRMLDDGGYFAFLVVHPFRQFLEKKKIGKDYYKKETIQSIIFGGKIIVTEPTHTLSEYINKSFLEKFSLIDLKEGSDFPNSEQIGGDIYPTYIIIVAQKKASQAK